MKYSKKELKHSAKFEKVKSLNKTIKVHQATKQVHKKKNSGSDARMKLDTHCDITYLKSLSELLYRENCSLRIHHKIILSMNHTIEEEMKEEEMKFKPIDLVE